MKSFKHILLPAFIMLAVSVAGIGTSYAQATSATLKGKVVEMEDGQTPVGFATVQVLPHGLATATK